MDNERPIDCVKLKNRIQAKLLREYEGLTPEEERRKRLQKLATDNSPAAKIWQSACKRQETASR